MLKCNILVFLQGKPHTEHYKYHRNYQKFIKISVSYTKNTHNSKIGEISTQYVGISHLLFISQKSQIWHFLHFSPLF